MRCFQNYTYVFQAELKDAIKRHISSDCDEPTFDGIIFTSQSAVNAFAACWAELRLSSDKNSLDKNLRKVPAFVVGGTTEKLVR